MLYVITGPPAAGKTTWVAEHATHGDVTIDLDSLAAALTPIDTDSHVYPKHVRSIAIAARRAAIEAALLHRLTDVYLIHTSPTDREMRRYERLRAEIVCIDPGRDVVLERCATMRPAQSLSVAREWYANRDYVPFC